MIGQHIVFGRRMGCRTEIEKEAVDRRSRPKSIAGGLLGASRPGKSVQYAKSLPLLKLAYSNAPSLALSYVNTFTHCSRGYPIISLSCVTEHMKSLFAHYRNSSPPSGIHPIALPSGSGPSLTLYHHSLVLLLNRMQQIHSRLRVG